MTVKAPKPVRGKSKRVTIMDVAKEAGVSIAAVSRILNNSYDGFSAREETKKRVFDAVKKLNYRASRAAVRLATGRHQAIALCYPDTGMMADPLDTSSIAGVFSQMHQMLQIRGVSRAASARNLDLVLMMRSADRPLDDLLAQAGESVDGIVYVHPEDDRRVMKKLEACELPLAVVGPGVSQGGRICAVQVDEFTAGRMAMGHLIVAGSRRIVVAVPQTQAAEAAVVKRLEGAKTVVEHYSDPSLTWDVVHLPPDIELARTTFLSHMGRWGRPDGVLTLGGIAPFAILKALFEKRLRVPDDVKLVGFDENPMFQLGDPPITGIRNPIEEMCFKATELLLDRMKTGETPPPVLLAPRMIARKSSEAAFSPLY